MEDGTGYIKSFHITAFFEGLLVAADRSPQKQFALLLPPGKDAAHLLITFQSNIPQTIHLRA
jgi:hypothetical protein